MKVLVACEFSGIVRDAFAARGHDAWSCGAVRIHIGNSTVRVRLTQIDGALPNLALMKLGRERRAAQ